MAYTDTPPLAIQEGEADSATLGWARNTTVVCQVNHPCDLYDVGCVVRVASSGTDMTLTVTRRVTPNSDTNATAVATLTLPSGTAAGKILYKAATSGPIHLNAGDELKFVASDNGVGVYWKPWVKAYPRPETKGNNTDFIESA